MVPKTSQVTATSLHFTGFIVYSCKVLCDISKQSILCLCGICKQVIIWYGGRFNGFDQSVLEKVEPVIQTVEISRLHVLITHHLQMCFCLLPRNLCSLLRWSHVANMRMLMGPWKRKLIHDLELERLSRCQVCSVSWQSCYKWNAELFTTTQGLK